MKASNDYLDFILNNRIPFYGKYASINRFLYIGTETLIVVLAAMTPILAALELSDSFIPNLEATLISSSILALAEGIARIFRFKNIWIRYRNCYNSLSREVRLYQNQSDYYKSASDPNELFQKNAESLINEEQSGWQKSVNEK